MGGLEVDRPRIAPRTAWFPDGKGPLDRGDVTAHPRAYKYITAHLGSMLRTYRKVEICAGQNLSDIESRQRGSQKRLGLATEYFEVGQVCATYIPEE